MYIFISCHINCKQDRMKTNRFASGEELHVTTHVNTVHVRM